MRNPTPKRFKSNGMRINTDGTTIKDRKPSLTLMPNHRHYLKRAHRIWNPAIQGTAVRDDKGWYKEHH
jgi:hypothetical protein